MIQLPKENIKEMIMAFLSLGATDINALLEAYQSKDWMLVGSTAHKMKSASESMGVLKLSELANEVEFVVRKAGYKSEELEANQFLQSKISEMDFAFRQSLAEFQAELESFAN